MFVSAYACLCHTNLSWAIITSSTAAMLWKMSMTAMVDTYTHRHGNVDILNMDMGVSGYMHDFVYVGICMPLGAHYLVINNLYHQKK
jgi:hypothetical protein